MSHSAENEHDLDHVIDDAARLWLAEQEPSMNDHPETEVLLAFQEGRLADDEARAVQDHVESCRSCETELAAFAAFDEAEASPESDSAEEAVLAASWQAFSARRELDRAQEPLPDNVVRDPRFFRRPAVWMAAAAMIVAALGIAYVFLSGRGGPQPDSQIASAAWPIELVPDGSSLVRSSEAVETFDIPSDRDQILANLRLGDQTLYSEFLAVVFDEAGNVELEVGQLRRDSLGRFPVTLPRDKLPVGELHRLVLFGLESDGRRNELATYSFRLRDAG